MLEQGHPRLRKIATRQKSLISKALLSCQESWTAGLRRISLTRTMSKQSSTVTTFSQIRHNLLLVELLYQLRKNFVDFFSFSLAREGGKTRGRRRRKSIVERIKNTRKKFSYKENVNIINDLSYLAVPIDQNKTEFKQLISKIKQDLKTDKSLASMHNF